VKLPGLVSCHTEIIDYLRILLAAFRNEMITAVDQKTETYAKTNFPMLLIFFEEVKVKRKLVQLLINQIGNLSANPNVDLNDVILKTIDRTSEHLMNVNLLRELLGRSDLSDVVRSRIQALCRSDDLHG
jgi:hypothetical protein